MGGLRSPGLRIAWPLPHGPDVASHGQSRGGGLEGWERGRRGRGPLRDLGQIQVLPGRWVECPGCGALSRGCAELRRAGAPHPDPAPAPAPLADPLPSRSKQEQVCMLGASSMAAARRGAGRRPDCTAGPRCPEHPVGGGGGPWEFLLGGGQWHQSPEEGAASPGAGAGPGMCSGTSAAAGFRASRSAPATALR